MHEVASKPGSLYTVLMLYNLWPFLRNFIKREQLVIGIAPTAICCRDEFELTFVTRIVLVLVDPGQIEPVRPEINRNLNLTNLMYPRELKA